MTNTSNKIIETSHTAGIESERLVKEISTSMPDLVYQFKSDADKAVSFTYVSEGAGLLLGIEPCEVYENVCFELVHPDGLAPLLNSVKVSENILVQGLLKSDITNHCGTQHNCFRTHSFSFVLLRHEQFNKINYSTNKEYPIIEPRMNHTNGTSTFYIREDSVSFDTKESENFLQ